MSEVKDRAEKIPERDFLAVYLKGCLNKKTRKQIAADLGMKLTSYRTREQQVKDKWKEQFEANGKEWPMPQSEQGTGGDGRVANFDAMQDLLKEAGFTV